MLTHLTLAFTPDWLVGSSAFLASTVEFVEAFTIVLVVGLTINWRSSLAGAGLATVALAVLIGIFGVTLVKFIPLQALRLVIGVILVLFGLKWLKKAILRYSGRKAFHDEEAIYEEEQAALKARGEAVSTQLDGFGVLTSFKSVLLEGLEVAFIVITFGATGSTHQNALANSDSLTSATIGAALALVVVVLAGVAVRAPLSRVPENTLKFAVGIMLTSFGTFWGGEGLGINWPNGGDPWLIPIIATMLIATFVMIQVLRQPQPTPSGAKLKPTAQG